MFDVPVFYFPKFFHPDPSVIRQSGFLKPELNESRHWVLHFIYLTFMLSQTIKI